MNPVSIQPGDSPIVLAMPHTGTYVPEEIWADLNALGQGLSDTDWHIDKLYADLLPNAAVVKANFHRYVIDANRDPSGQSLYPGQNTTGLCPLTDFDGNEIYNSGSEPTAKEIESRRIDFHAPYHQAIEQQLAKAQEKHGIAILYDCHSIRSLIPYLFEGKLPDFNIGTFDGQSCDIRLSEVVDRHCQQSAPYSSVLNGRFKGGWTTRHYGLPQNGVHAIQMELAQCNYMEEHAPWHYQPEAAEQLRKALRPMLEALASTAQSL